VWSKEALKRRIHRQVVHPMRNRPPAQHSCRLHKRLLELTRHQWPAVWPAARVWPGGETRTRGNLLNCLDGRLDPGMGLERGDKTNQVTSRVLFVTGKRVHYPYSGGGVSDRSLLRRLRVCVHGGSIVQLWKVSKLKKLGEEGISGK
jgi:hypothetical protein